MVTVLVFSLVPGCYLHAQKSVGKILQTDRINVMVFISTDCPISQDYIGKLNKIYTDRRDENISFTGIVPGKVKKKSILQFTQEYQVRFPIKVDKRYKYVKKLDALVTPEVFIFGRDGKLRYRGAIDDWYYELGRHRSEPTKYYLTDALNSVISGTRPAIIHTEAIGCLIQRPKSKK